MAAISNAEFDATTTCDHEIGGFWSGVGQTVGWFAQAAVQRQSGSRPDDDPCQSGAAFDLVRTIVSLSRLGCLGPSSDDEASFESTLHTERLILDELAFADQLSEQLESSAIERVRTFVLSNAFALAVALPDLEAGLLRDRASAQAWMQGTDPRDA